MMRRATKWRCFLAVVISVAALALGMPGGAQAQGIGAGSLAAPSGPAPTGVPHNNTHWKVLAGSTIAGTISGATDAVVNPADQPCPGGVDVQIQSSAFGNTLLCGSISGSTISFTWAIPASGVCETTIVAYGAHHQTTGRETLDVSNNDIVDLLFGVTDIATAAAGYAIVDASGVVVADLNGEEAGCGSQERFPAVVATEVHRGDGPVLVETSGFIHEELITLPLKIGRAHV